MERNVILDLPYEVLSNMQFGEMAYATYTISNDTDIHPCLCIKEDADHIMTLYSKNSFEFKTGIFSIKNVLLVPLMVQINEKMNMTYETWINYCSPQAKNYLDLLSKCEYIDVLFFNRDNKNIRKQIVSFSIKNNITSFIHILSDYENWSMDDFDEARNTFYSNDKYDSVEKLWFLL